MLAFRYRPAAELRSLRSAQGRRPHGTRLGSLRAQPPAWRDAARQGPDRALLVGVARRHVRHARPGDDPPSGVVCRQHPPPRLAAPVRRLPRPAAPDARLPGAVRGRRSARRASRSPISWTRRSCSGTCSTAPSPACRSGGRTGSTPGRRTSPATRSRGFRDALLPARTGVDRRRRAARARDVGRLQPGRSDRVDSIRRNSAAHVTAWKAHLTAPSRPRPPRHRAAGEPVVRLRRLVGQPRALSRSWSRIATAACGATGTALLDPGPPQGGDEHLPQGGLTAVDLECRDDRAVQAHEVGLERAAHDPLGEGRPAKIRVDGHHSSVPRPRPWRPSPPAGSPPPIIW